MLAITAKNMLLPDGTFAPGRAVLTDNGKIIEITEHIPEGTPRLDIPGGWMTPGLIESHGHLTELNSNEESGPVTAEADVRDILDPTSKTIRVLRENGFTSFCTMPGSANLFGGVGAGVKLREAHCVEDMLIDTCRPVKMALGDNPTFFYGKKGVMPASGMGSAALIRKTFLKARAYLEKREKDELDAPDLAMEPLADALCGKTFVKIHCHAVPDILTAVRLAREFGLRYTIEHATSGKFIADYLAEQNVRVCLGPLLMEPLKDEMKDLGPDNPGLMEKAGVHFSLIHDSGWDTFCLPSIVGICVSRGLSHAAGMRGLTTEAARNLGLESRLGSLLTGMDADIAVFDGDPLSNSTRCLATMIDGKLLWQADSIRKEAR